MPNLPTAPMANITTAAQLLRFRDPPFRHELVRGELRTMSPAGHWHGDVIAALTERLRRYVRSHQLGRIFVNDTGFVLAHRPDTVLAPDLAFVRQERLPPPRSPGFYEGPPDVAIEVRSPGDSRRAHDRKGRAWLRHGTPCVWLCDPEDETVTVLRSQQEPVVVGASGILSGSPEIRGFRVRLRTIFPR
ncbi:MAG: Uma2 family endonuclease [Planctomycetes bacterium]|nr:Uma2 family endonuclease [Planctomycetota bacterium]